MHLSSRPTSNIQHQTFNIQHSTSNIQNQTSNIQHSTLNIQHPTLNIEHPTFNIQHSTFKIQHPTSNSQHSYSLFLNNCFGKATVTNNGAYITCNSWLQPRDRRHQQHPPRQRHMASAGVPEAMPASAPIQCAFLATDPQTVQVRDDAV